MNSATLSFTGRMSLTRRNAHQRRELINNQQVNLLELLLKEMSHQTISLMYHTYHNLGLQINSITMRCHLLKSNSSWELRHKLIKMQSLRICSEPESRTQHNMLEDKSRVSHQEVMVKFPIIKICLFGDSQMLHNNEEQHLSRTITSSRWKQGSRKTQKIRNGRKKRKGEKKTKDKKCSIDRLDRQNRLRKLEKQEKQLPSKGMKKNRREKLKYRDQ